MSSPPAGNPNPPPPPPPPPPQHSDCHIIHYISASTDNNFTISQLNSSKTTNTNPAFSPNPNPSINTSSGKRRKAKPVRFIATPTPTVVDNSVESPLQNVTVVEDPSSKSLSSAKQNSAIKCVNSPVERTPAVVRAEEVQLSLGTEHPTCVKLMVKSHVDMGYWMGFPYSFGRLYLPKADCEMLVEDENGMINHIKYISDKSGLCAGWKKFAAGHKLVVGDALVFQLVEPSKFKVYIIRKNDLNEVAGSLCLLNTEEQMIPETDMPAPIPKKRMRPNSPPLIEQSGNDSEEVGSEVLEDSRTSKLDLSLEELKTLEDFHIMVKGVCIDSEFPDDVRMNYYKLCISRKELLHDDLPEGLYCKLVPGMIGETVSIANKIMNSKITTTIGEFEAWDKSLKSFSLMGMKVDFLRERIVTLSRFLFESECRLDMQKYVEVKNEQKLVEDEIRSLTEKLVGLNESSKKLKGIVDGLEEKIEMHEVKFQEHVNALW